MTLGDLKTQFTAMLNNRVITNNPTLVSTFINQAIMRLQRELRVPFMEKQILYTVPADGSFTKLAIPADLLELKDLMVDRDNDGILEYELRRKRLMDVVRATENTMEPPAIYARQGGAWILGPKPAPSSQVLIYYYAEFAPLTLDTDTNTALKVAWDAVLYGALSAAYSYLKDAENFTGSEAIYTQITKGLQDMADADELSADAVMSPALNYCDGEW